MDESLIDTWSLEVLTTIDEPLECGDDDDDCEGDNAVVYFERLEESTRMMMISILRV